MLSDEQRRRLEQEKKSTEQFYELQREKINRLQKAFYIETAISHKFQWEQQIKAEEIELKKLTDRLDELEKQLQLTSSIKSAIKQVKSLSDIPFTGFETSELGVNYTTMGNGHGESLRASAEGFKIAKKAFKRKNLTQEYLAESVSCSHQVVIHFFARRNIEKHLFQAICNELNLEWGDIAELELEKERLSGLGMNSAQENTIVSIQQHPTTEMLTVPKLETTEKEINRPYEAMLVFSAKLTADNEAQLKDKKRKIEVLITHLCKIVEDESLTIIDIEEGSIKIILGGSPESLKRLNELFKLGELNEILEIPVEDIQVSEVTEEQHKSRIVKGIINKKIIGKNLSGFNLSGVKLNDVDLSGFNLKDTNLSCTDLSSANLSNTNLSGADLFSANLSSANLSDANLNGADLYDADLSNTVLSLANLIGADLSRADLSLANLSGANLSHANLRGANLRGADLNSADLYGAVISKADLSHTNLNRANLSNADLSNVELSGADLRGVRINEAKELDQKWLLIWKIVNQKAIGQNLSNTNLKDTYLKSSNPRNAKPRLKVAASYYPDTSFLGSFVMPDGTEQLQGSDILTRLHSGEFFIVNSRRRNGLILFKRYHAEFAGPGAAVGGDYDCDCQRALPIGNLSLLTPESYEERQKAYLIRRQWIRLIKQITENPIPGQRVQKIIDQFEQYFPPEVIAQLPNEAFALLVGVLPQTVAQVAQVTPSDLTPTEEGEAHILPLIKTISINQEQENKSNI